MSGLRDINHGFVYDHYTRWRVYFSSYKCMYLYVSGLSQPASRKVMMSVTASFKGYIIMCSNTIQCVSRSDNHGSFCAFLWFDG